jgi:hypothetical protein
MKKSATKSASITRIAPRRMNAGERVMWREYEKLRAAKAPRSALAAWARKHKVELGSGGRVVLERNYAAPVVTAKAKSCSDRCGMDKFETTTIVNKRKVAMSCKLDGCFYSRDLRAWVCSYECTAVSKAIR